MVGLMVRSGRHTTGVPDTWEPRPGCLSIAEREEILVGLRAGDSLSAIARRLEQDSSTVTREVAANGGRDGYAAWNAHQRDREAAWRPKPCKLRAGRLLDEVTKRLEQLWSADEIARRLLLDFPDDPEMWVSHETIYRSLVRPGPRRTPLLTGPMVRSGRTTRKRSAAPSMDGDASRDGQYLRKTR